MKPEHIEDQALWGWMLLAGLFAFKTLNTGKIFNERKSSDHFKKNISFSIISHRCKSVQTFSNLLSDKCHSISSISPLIHQMLTNTVRLNLFVHLVPFAAFAYSFRLKPHFTHKCTSGYYRKKKRNNFSFAERFPFGQTHSRGLLWDPSLLLLSGLLGSHKFNLINLPENCRCNTFCFAYTVQDHSEMTEKKKNQSLFCQLH